MRMLIWMCSKIKNDKTRNKRFGKHLRVATIGDKTRETRLGWFGHVQRRPATGPAKKGLAMKVDDPPRGRGREKERG